MPASQIKPSALHRSPMMPRLQRDAAAAAAGDDDCNCTCVLPVPQAAANDGRSRLSVACLPANLSAFERPTLHVTLSLYLFLQHGHAAALHRQMYTSDRKQTKLL